MRLREMTPEYRELIALWPKLDRLEEQTCRPVAYGQRVTPSHEAAVLAFFTDDCDEPVGKFTFFDVNSRNQSAEFGYVVHPAFRKRGIGTSMVITGVDYLFSEIKLNKVYCQTATFNIASVRLLERLGFHKDAVLREHHELDGKLWDDFIYSQLRSEWLRRTPQPALPVEEKYRRPCFR